MNVRSNQDAVSLTLVLDEFMVLKSSTFLAETLATMSDYYYYLILFGEIDLTINGQDLGYKLILDSDCHISLVLFVTSMDYIIRLLEEGKCNKGEVSANIPGYRLTIEVEAVSASNGDAICKVSNFGAAAFCELAALKEALTRSKLTLLRQVARFRPEPLIENLTKLDSYIEGTWNKDDW